MIRVRNLQAVLRKGGGLFRAKRTEEWALKGVGFEVRTGESCALGLIPAVSPRGLLKRLPL